MGDGSVRFAKETIYPRTWVSLSTRNGGEVISGDSLIATESPEAGAAHGASERHRTVGHASHP